MRKSTYKAKESIKFSEQLRLIGYRCAAGAVTNGYGHTRTAILGEKISLAKAEFLLDKDIETVEDQLNPVLEKCIINQNQFDSLVSFVFNIGIGNFLRSTMLKTIIGNANNPMIAKQFDAWIYGGNGQNNGKDDDKDGLIDEKGEKLRLPGLITRRKRESDLYFSL